MSALVIIILPRYSISVLLSSLHVVAESLDLIQLRGGSKIEHLCVGRCQQLGWGELKENSQLHFNFEKFNQISIRK